MCTSTYCLNGGTCSVSLNINIQCRCPADTSGTQCEFYNGPENDFLYGTDKIKVGSAVGSVAGVLFLVVLALTVYGIYRYATRKSPVDPFLENPIYGVSDYGKVQQKTEGIEMGQHGKYTSIIENDARDTTLMATVYTSVDEGKCSSNAL